MDYILQGVLPLHASTLRMLPVVTSLCHCQFLLPSSGIRLLGLPALHCLSKRPKLKRWASNRARVVIILIPDYFNSRSHGFITMTESAELVQRRGRWASWATMTIYLQEVAASTYLNDVEPIAKQSVLSGIFFL